MNATSPQRTPELATSSLKRSRLLLRRLRRVESTSTGDERGGHQREPSSQKMCTTSAENNAFEAVSLLVRHSPASLDLKRRFTFAPNAASVYT